MNLSGASIPFRPEFTGNVGIAYDFKIGGYLTPRVDYSHQDETQAALWDSPWDAGGARPSQRTDLLCRNRTNGPRCLSTNLTNEEYIAGIQNNATPTTRRRPDNTGFGDNFGL